MNPVVNRILTELNKIRYLSDADAIKIIQVAASKTGVSKVVKTEDL